MRRDALAKIFSDGARARGLVAGLPIGLAGSQVGREVLAERMEKVSHG